MSGAAAIAERGEHMLDLAGASYRLRPSHQAMRAIEAKTERSSLELVRMGNVGALSLDQLGTIAAELIRAGAEDEMTRSVHPERIGELIYEQGVAGVTFRLTAVLADAVSGGRKASGEAKAAAATTTGTAGAA
ncbi:MAG: GTA-gp10 family protein [Sphingomonas sp.]